MHFKKHLRNPTSNVHGGGGGVHSLQGVWEWER